MSAADYWSGVGDGQLVAASPSGLPVPFGNPAWRSFPHMLIDNPGPLDVFVSAGLQDVVATQTSQRIPAGAMRVLTKGSGTHVAALCLSGSQNIKVFVGDISARADDGGSSGEGTSTVSGAGNPDPESLRRWLPAPVLQHVSSGGAPSLASVTSDQTTVFYWSMSGGTAGQSVVGAFDKLSDSAAAYGIKVSVRLTTNNPSLASHHTLRAVVAALREGQAFAAKQFVGNPSVGKGMGSGMLTTQVVESFIPIETNRPLSVRIIRDNADAADDNANAIGIVGISVEAMTLAAPITVQPAVKYNSWPMLWAIGSRLVCAYARGDTHTLSPADGSRGVFCRISIDGGRTWGSESPVTDLAGVDESAVGRGVDAAGNLLVWVRRGGLDAGRTFHLYRSTDAGVTWALVSSPAFATNPIQIADIISLTIGGVPTLMAFYHAGTYGSGGAVQSWGKVVSTDGGLSWTQTAIETGLLTAAWPTEISAVYLGGGKILAIGRNETSDTDTASTKANFQMVSSSFGADGSWTKALTNVTDTNKSSPSLVYDSGTDALTLYYFHRGWGVQKRRKTLSATVFAAPLDWADSEALALGTANGSDTGNSSAAITPAGQVCVYYSGDATDAGVYAVRASA